MNIIKQNSHSMAREFARNYLAVSLIPLILLLALALSGIVVTRAFMGNLITKTTYDLNGEAEAGLQKLGEKIIQMKARDGAKQIEIYFRMHPNHGIREMRRDPLFMDMALQKVGKTGYTAIYETGIPIFRVHPNRNLIDKDVAFLAKDLPSWWTLVKATLSGAEVSGYYDWRDSDGSIRKKYMTITPVKVPLQGKIMMFAATTYIDEFSAPVTAMKKKADKIADMYQHYMSRQLIIFGIIATGLILLTFYGIYFLGRRTAFRYILPIIRLAERAREFGGGKWDSASDDEVIRRGDEIGTLARAFDSMARELKDLFNRLEKHVLELNQTQHALRASEEHYRSLFHGVPVGLYRTSPDGRIIDVNDMLVRMLGYPDRETFLRKKAMDLYADTHDRDTWEAMMKDKEVVQAYEIRFCKYDGKEVWMENNAHKVCDENGNLIYYEGSLMDITERKRMESHLQHIERMEAIGTLAGGVAHDFNNLLMVIQGGISLMLLDLDAAHPFHKYLIDIQKQVQRGSKLTGQLLGYASKGKYEVRVINLNEIIVESIETCQRTRKDILVHYDLDPDLHLVEVDIYQIEQTLINLYLNAFDAMPDGGDLFLTTRNISPEEMPNRVYDPKPGSYVMVMVGDNGVGMDKKIMDRIFEPFFTTKEMTRGTGLGLASAYGIVKGHGGFIEVASETGRGTVFTLYFPVSVKTNKWLPGESKRALKGRGMILLVDDEKLVLEVGAKMLKKLGYTVIKSPNGRKAIEIYKKNHGRIDLIILDMIMPDIGGGQAFDRFREINPNAVVLLSSGYSIDGKATEILNRGCSGFIQKPFSIEELSEKIQGIITG